MNEMLVDICINVLLTLAVVMFVSAFAILIALVIWGIKDCVKNKKK